MFDAVIRRAPGKLNLMLSVGPPEPTGSDRPGWHRIASWVCCVNLADEVRVHPAAEYSLERRWSDDAPRPSPIDWDAESDLVTRAARALEGEIGRAVGARVELIKRIPTGAGLGGGSSDAAAALLALRDAVAPEVPDDALVRLGGTIGSDVRFFVDPPNTVPRPAFMHGFGEIDERYGSMESGVVLIVPPVSCSTPAVYRGHDSAPTDLDERRVREAARAGNVAGAGLFNDLLAPALRVEPALRGVLERARRAAGRAVYMTGSGSCLFALGDAALAARLSDELPDCAVVATRLI